MDRDSPPPAPAKVRLSKLDFFVFGAVMLLMLYAAYRVNDVLVYNWNWGRVLSFVVRYDDESGTWVSNLLLQGLATTLRLAFRGTILAAIIGVVMGFCRTGRNLTLRMISRVYVELIRNTPPIVFIFIFFFFISSQIFPLLGLDGIDSVSLVVDNPIFTILFGKPSLLLNFLSGLICLALFEGA